MPLPLRIATALLTLFVGAVIGAVTTFAHAALEPWALIAGLVIVAAYVLGARFAFEERLAGVVAAAGVIVTVMLIAVVPVDAVVIHPERPLDLVWLVAAPLVAVAALLWPVRDRPAEASESP